jgi:hypothetical protein
VTFELLYDFEAIARAEEITGRSLLMGFTQKDIRKPTIPLVRAMLFAGLLPKEPEITLAEASAFVTRKSIYEIWAKVLDAWVIAMAPPEDTPADPPKGQS